MEVSNDILKFYNNANEFDPCYINKNTLYTFVGMLYLDGHDLNEIDHIVKDIKNNPYTYVEKSSDFNKVLNDLDTLVDHYGLPRDNYQILSDAFDKEASYFITMNKRDDFILVENRLSNKYHQYLFDRKF